MRRRGEDQYDRLAWRDYTGAVDDRQRRDRPPAGGLRGDPGNLLFRHAGIVLELERGQPASFVAAPAGERHDAADVGAPGGDATRLLADVEGLPLHAAVRIPGLHVGSASRHWREEGHLPRAAQ